MVIHFVLPTVSRNAHPKSRKFPLLRTPQREYLLILKEFEKIFFMKIDDLF